MPFARDSETRGEARAPRESGRLLPLVLPATLAGAGALLAALWSLASSDPALALAVGALGLLAASTLVAAIPLPAPGGAAGGVSLAAVAAIVTAVVYGWEAGAVLAFVARALVELEHGRAALRRLYNGAIYALAGGAAGLAAEGVPLESTLASTPVEVLAASAAFSCIAVLALAAGAARLTGDPIASLLRRGARGAGLPVLIAVPAAAMMETASNRAPLLGLAVACPLLALAFSHRWARAALRAMRLALIDPLTGLGNRRHFQERLERDLARAEAAGTPLTLCLIDVDDFKEVNDVHGHPAGDRVLAEVATRLRRCGEAFRLGGDEFAVLLPGYDESEGRAVAEAVASRIVAADSGHGAGVSVSMGVATFRRQGVGREDLVRAADAALYQAKESGKGCVRVYRPDVVELSEWRHHANESEHGARVRRAVDLLRAAGQRNPEEREASAVGELAARVGARMGLDAEQIELIRVAGSLSDLGKLAMPEEILGKPGPLTEHERGLVERHPQLGFRVLRSLGLEPVAKWVLHHHERWDGSGYPHRLSGEEIPLAARILFAADAYDAMTADRAYRLRLSPERALEELERCAGTQFDPTVVAALAAEVRQDEPLAPVAAERS